MTKFPKRPLVTGRKTFDDSNCGQICDRPNSLRILIPSTLTSSATAILDPSLINFVVIVTPVGPQSCGSILSWAPLFGFAV